MGKEIVKNLEPEEQSRMSVENAEINILYTTAFAIYILAQDAERRMNNSGMSLGFRRKQLFNGIIMLRLGESKLKTMTRSKKMLIVLRDF